MTTVTVTCDTSGTYTGVFADNPLGAPTITVAVRAAFTCSCGVTVSPACAGRAASSWVSATTRTLTPLGSVRSTASPPMLSGSFSTFAPVAPFDRTARRTWPTVMSPGFWLST